MTTAARPWWRRPRRWLVGALVALLVWWGSGLIGAHLLTQPVPRAMPQQHELAGRPIEPIAATASDGVVGSGWLVRASDASSDVVVLAAGIRGNRLAMLERGAWYLAHGWSVLLVDLRGTGASAPAHIAMGWHEALDLAAWHAAAAARGFRRIGVHGQSLGAAAAVFTAVRCTPPPAWHFVVIESCYRDIDDALAARLPWLPRPLLWPLVTSTEWLLALSAQDLVPMRAIAQLRAPTLLACGSDDAKVGPHALDDLFAASAAASKERVEIPGAGHVDLWHAAGDLLPQRLAAFLAAR